MSDKRAPTSDRIFARLLELESPADRARYLREVCAGDSALHAEILSLLSDNTEFGELLDDPAVHSQFRDPAPMAGLATPAPGPGAEIGPYRVLGMIGEGGMGMVFLAEQTHPVRRQVALKIIKPGMDSRDVITRFEGERQALAILDHPNIATVLDAGATASGRPYFVMELVKGVPITQYCNEGRLSPRERLALFVTVCRAVQHAHQKGIIHRDIKPSNVLVSEYDGRPVPKVIDFGLAKATEQRLTENTLLTQHGAIVGTLEYMSPEQVEEPALDVDTRTDVYALGILLYELLTGTTPLDRQRMQKVSFTEIVRRIREEEPPKLSTRLSKTSDREAIALERGMAPAKLARLVRGELDWIAVKALEKERDRRYATANDLARDVERFLAQEPVEAGPPTAAYRLSKFARRHRAALVTAAAFALVLLAATAISVDQAVKSRRSAREAQAVLKFFRDKILAGAKPPESGGLGRLATLRAVIDAAEPGIADAFADQPTVEATIRDDLGATYQDLGEPALAIPQHERALALRAQALGPEHASTMTSMNNLAVAYQAAGRNDEAVALHEREFATSTKTLGPNHPDTLKSMSNLANAYRVARRAAEAVPIFTELLARREASNADTSKTKNNLALCYLDLDRTSDALRLFKEVYEYSRAHLGPQHEDLLIADNNLAAAYVRAGEPAKAIPLFVEALEIRQEKLGADHPYTLTSLNNLAVAYQLANQITKALTLFEQVLPARKAKLGADHVDTLKTMNSFALALCAVGRPTEAITLLKESLNRPNAKLDSNHAEALDMMNNLADAYLATQRWAEAEELLKRCRALRDKTSFDPWRPFQTISQLGAALAGEKRYAEAEPLLLDGYAGLAARRAKIPFRFQTTVNDAAARTVAFYEQTGKPDQAHSWRLKMTPAPEDPPR